MELYWNFPKFYSEIFLIFLDPIEMEIDDPDQDADYIVSMRFKAWNFCRIPGIMDLEILNLAASQKPSILSFKWLVIDYLFTFLYFLQEISKYSCRVCLKTEEFMISLFEPHHAEETIAAAFKYCTGLDVSTN